MSIEAMKQVLEALYISSSCVDPYYVPLGKSMIPEVEAAIDVLSQAIEQAEKQETICPRCGATLVTPYGWQSVANPSEWLDDLRGIDE